jgi:acetyl-CoA carboxylase carboxyl transferase subunit beta
MSILAWIEDQRKLKLLNAPKYNHLTSDGSQGLWTRCDHCGVILYIKHLKENQRVCFGCGFHLQMSSHERIENLIDTDTWRPLDETVSPCDPLEFRDQKAYTERLKEAQERTRLQDAIQTGTGMLDGIPIALGVMDFNFMGGSMGSVVGEKITRLIEYATQEGLTLVLVCASGGARMQEGILSLMQMAKISAALQVYQSCANLLYISILTSPTTGGVTASFAMLGDLIFAEPKALIGFAGRRVIEQTLQEQLPDDFQTAEYLLHHGLLDLIVPRSFLKQALSETITLYKEAPFRKSGSIPHGTQSKLGFVTEEKIRRKCINFSSIDDFYKAPKKYYSTSFSKTIDLKSLETFSYENLGSNLFNQQNFVNFDDTHLNSTFTGRSSVKSKSISKDFTNQYLPLLNKTNTNKSLTGEIGNPKKQGDKQSSLNTKDSNWYTFSSSASALQEVKQAQENNLQNLILNYNEAPSEFYYRKILLSFQTLFALVESLELAIPKGEYSQNDGNRILFSDEQNFFNKAISLAKTEDIEWRTIYSISGIDIKTSALEGIFKRINLWNIFQTKKLNSEKVVPDFETTENTKLPKIKVYKRKKPGSV